MTLSHGPLLAVDVRRRRLVLPQIGEVFPHITCGRALGNQTSHSCDFLAGAEREVNALRIAGYPVYPWPRRRTSR